MIYFFVILLFCVYLVWYFFFNIYEIKIFPLNSQLELRVNTSLEFEAVPINLFGNKIPFRNVVMEFKIDDDSVNKLIELQKNDRGILSFIATSDSGEVKLYINTIYSSYPSVYTIKLSK